MDIFIIYLSILVIALVVVAFWAVSDGLCGGMNYPIDRRLNALLKHKLSKGIKKITSEWYYINIQFNDNTVAHMWNSNRYYAWLSRGYIGDFHWDSARPTRMVMWKLKRAIDKYYNNLPL